MTSSNALKLFFLIPIIFGQILYAADYKIDGEIKGLESGKIYLQEFYGDESSIIDSAFIDAESRFSFRMKATKAPGQYRLIFSERRFLDLVFNKEDIKFSTSLLHLINDMEILVSNENHLYYRYLKFRIKSQRRIDELRKQLYAYNDTHALYKELRGEYKSLIGQEEEFINQLIESNPGLFATNFIRIDREPNPDPAWDTKKTNQWVFDHYPDYFLFNDTTLLRTNAVSAKIIAYLSVTLSLHNHPDSLVNALETASFRLLASTGNSEKMFHFMQQYLSQGFNRLAYPEIVALIDEIPYPCCPCEIFENKGTNSKTKGKRMPSVILLENNMGEEVEIPLRKVKTQLLLTAPDCKWGDLMASQFENESQEGDYRKNHVIIYKAGETPTFKHSSSNVYYISEKNLVKFLKIGEINQRPVLITIDKLGKVTEKVTSWLQLM